MPRYPKDRAKDANFNSCQKIYSEERTLIIEIGPTRIFLRVNQHHISRNKITLYWFLKYYRWNFIQNESPYATICYRENHSIQSYCRLWRQIAFIHRASAKTITNPRSWIKFKVDIVITVVENITTNYPKCFHKSSQTKILH